MFLCSSKFIIKYLKLKEKFDFTLNLSNSDQLDMLK